MYQDLAILEDLSPWRNWRSRAVSFAAKVLLLEEPAVSLSARETANALQAIISARLRGLAVLYIDHNPRHLLPVASDHCVGTRARHR